MKTLSGFPFSMENIPRQSSFACLSLKLGSILSALLIILYSVLFLALSIAAFCEMASQTRVDNAESMVLTGVVVAITISHCVTLFLTALMLVGVLRAVGTERRGAVKYMVRVLRGELHHPAVLAALRLRVPNDYLGLRRRPAMLEEKLHLIRPWLVWTSIQLMVYVMLTVYWTVTNFTNHTDDGNSLFMFVFGFLSLLIRFYMLMLVASYYKQLEEEQFDGERAKTLVHKDTWYNSA